MSPDLNRDSEFEEIEEQTKFYTKSPLDVRAEIQLDLSYYGRSLPTGHVTDFRVGYSFYELFNDKDVSQRSVYITSRITHEAILVAVTKRQYEVWSKKAIIARPAQFTWRERRGIWEIQDQV